MSTRRDEIRRELARLRRQIASLEQERRQIDYEEAMKNQLDMFEAQPDSGNNHKSQAA